MTSPSKYTIQLLEGIHDDAQRHDLANDAARLLGTNADQLEQLLARGIGARIARAGSEKRAEHVAGLLRSVGVKVEVVAPDAGLSDTGLSDAGLSDAGFSESNLAANSGLAQEAPAFEASFEEPSNEASESLESPASIADAVAQASSDEAGSTWWLPNSVQADTSSNEGSFATVNAVDPFESVIGAQATLEEPSSANQDPFSTLLPSDDSSANWSATNDQVSAPWLNSSALVSNAGAVPFEPANAFGSDPFQAAAGSDPFASAIVEQYPAITGHSSNPFGTADSAPFETSNSDPFGPVTNSDPFENDPFAASTADPFAASTADPFAASTADPFAAPNSDPFGPASDTYTPASSTATVIRNDPFAAPMGAAQDPFAPISDPFAAPSGDLAPVISLTSTSELPPQARAARDRAPRRSSIQTKTIVALIVPMLLVVAGIIGFLTYQLPTTITTLLKARATAIASVTAESLRPNFDRGDVSQANIDSLSGLAEGSLLKVPYGAFFMIEHEAREIRQVATDTDIASADLVDFFKKNKQTLDDGTEKELLNGQIVNLNGINYIAAAAPFTSTNMMGHGKAWVLIGLKMDPIGESLRNTLIPIFVVIGIMLLLALVIGTGLARSLLRPIIAATQQANRISLGDLDRTVPKSGNDEIGDLLVALEQMRVSLKSMVARLRRDRA